jgi:hypothetical protein
MNTRAAKEVRAKLFVNGRSQAVRVPKEFRFEGKELRVSHALGGGVAGAGGGRAIPSNLGDGNL